MMCDVAIFAVLDLQLPNLIYKSLLVMPALHASYPYIILLLLNFKLYFSSSKCERLLAMDESLALILPPVRRTYQNASTSKFYTNQLTSTDRGHGCNSVFAYHVGCSTDDL